MRRAAKSAPKVGIVVYSYYPHDLRIRRAAEAALQASYRVDVYCLRGPGQPKIQRQQGLTIYRLGILRSRSGKINYILEYLSFLVSVFLRLSHHNLAERYAAVHFNNMPDFLVFAGIGPKLSGAGIILDLHDPMPEVFQTKYGTGERSRLVRFLVFLERASIRFSHQVITTNIAFRDLFVRRGCPPEKIQIVMNAPEESMFAPRPGIAAALPSGPNAFRVVFNGTVVERHGLDTAIDAILSLRSRIPQIRFDIYGDGDYAERLARRIGLIGASGSIEFHGFVHVAELADIIRSADVGVIPNIRSVFTEINFPVRIFEYLMLGKPVIAPRTRGIGDYFKDGQLLMFEPGNVNDLAEKIYFVYSRPDQAREVVRNGAEVYSRHRWALQREVLIGIYDRLADKAGRSRLGSGVRPR